MPRTFPPSKPPSSAKRIELACRLDAGEWSRADAHALWSIFAATGRARRLGAIVEEWQDTFVKVAMAIGTGQNDAERLALRTLILGDGNQAWRRFSELAATTADQARLSELFLKMAALFAPTDPEASVNALARLTAIAPTDAWALWLIGRMTESLGELGTATKFLEQLLELETGAGEKVHAVITLSALGRIAAADGRKDLAAARFLQAIELSDTIDEKPDAAEQLGDIGDEAIIADTLDVAENAFERALALLRGHGSDTFVAEFGLGRVHLLRGELALAERQLTRASKTAIAAGREFEIALALRALGLTKRENGDPEGARRYWEHALALFEEQERPDEVAKLRGLLEKLEAPADGSPKPPSGA